MFGRACQTRKFDGLIVAQGHADEFVIPRQRALHIEHAQFFIVSNADGGVGQGIYAFEIEQIRRKKLHGVVMLALFFLSYLEALQP